MPSGKPSIASRRRSALRHALEQRLLLDARAQRADDVALDVAEHAHHHQGEYQHHSAHQLVGPVRLHQELPRHCRERERAEAVERQRAGRVYAARPDQAAAGDEEQRELLRGIACGKQHHQRKAPCRARGERAQREAPLPGRRLLRPRRGALVRAMQRHAQQRDAKHRRKPRQQHVAGRHLPQQHQHERRDDRGSHVHRARHAVERGDARRRQAVRARRAREPECRRVQPAPGSRRRSHRRRGRRCAAR